MKKSLLATTVLVTALISSSAFASDLTESRSQLSAFKNISLSTPTMDELNTAGSGISIMPFPLPGNNSWCRFVPSMCRFIPLPRPYPIRR